VRAQRDPDLLLVEAMLAPPPLEDARSSLEYWERRHKASPIYHRRARREAREMAARWEERVRAAERIRFEASVLGRALVALRLSRLVDWRVRLTKWRVIALAWAFVPRRFKLIAFGVVAAWLVVAVATIAVCAALLAQLA
jgi:hypothetical protein